MQSSGSASFTDADLTKLLAPAVYPSEYCDRLKLIQRFFAACASQIDVAFRIVHGDPRLFQNVDVVYYILNQLCTQVRSSVTDGVANIERESSVRRISSRLAIASSYRVSVRLQRPSSIFRLLGLSQIAGQWKIAQMLIDVNLADIVGAFNRLGSMAAIAAIEAGNPYRDPDLIRVDGAFDPTRADPIAISRFLIEARARFDSLPLEDKIKRQIIDEIDSVRSETTSVSPRWSKVFSRLAQLIIYAAAVTSAVADADKAMDNLRRAFDTLGKMSVAVERDSRQPNSSLLLSASPTSPSHRASVSSTWTPQDESVSSFVGPNTNLAPSTEPRKRIARFARHKSGRIGEVLQELHDGVQVRIDADTVDFWTYEDISDSGDSIEL